MDCERYQVAIRDKALGGPAGSALEAHLRQCEACRATLVQEERRLQALDRALGAVLCVEAAPDLAARIRVGIEAVRAAPERAVWRRWLAGSVRVPIPFLVAGAVVLAVAMGLLLQQRAKVTPEIPASPEHAVPAENAGEVPALAFADLTGFEPMKQMRIVVLPRKARETRTPTKP